MQYSYESSYNKSQIGTDVVYSTQEDDIDTDKTHLELSNREIDLVEQVTQDFNRVYVTPNSANSMELGWLEEYWSIQAAHDTLYAVANSNAVEKNTGSGGCGWKPGLQLGKGDYR